MTTTDITRPPLRSRRGLAADGKTGDQGRLTAIAGVAAVLIGCLAAIGYAAISGISEWSELVVLAGIALATVGLMIAIDPLRRER
jgi:predicted acyltransferase